MSGRGSLARGLAAGLALAFVMLLGAACATTAEPALEEAAADTEAETVTAPAVRSRLETVRERGRLICASLNDTPGFGYVDEAGNSVGFDIDLCRAVAAAVLGNGVKCRKLQVQQGKLNSCM